MKKSYFFSLVLAFLTVSTMVNGQTNFVLNPGLEQWDDNETPTSWGYTQNVTQESATVHSGSYSAAHESASSSKKMRQEFFNVVPGTEYTISYWYYDNDPSARTRIWSYWLAADSTTMTDNEDVLRPNVYSEDNASWQQWSTTLTAPVGAAGFRFEVRVYKQDGNTGGKVYYDDFYFGGESTVDPEPSNYPTDFNVALNGNGLSAVATWADATGDDLPSGYLIIAAINQSDLYLPQDGTSYMDDNDWSDGIVTHNVNYGVQSDEFSNLVGGTAYYFVIYPFSNGGDNIDYKTDGEAPNASVETPNVVVIGSQNFEDGTLGLLTVISVVGEQTWENSEYNGNKFAKMSGYAGGSHANEDWLISPEANLANFVSINFQFSNAKGYNGDPLQLLISTDYNGTGDPNDFNWTDLSDQVTWSEGNFNWVTTSVDLSDYSSTPFRFAFKYTSTDEQSATWELDDFIMTGITVQDINENENNEVQIYPNPVVSNFNINLKSSATITLYDLTGKVIMTQELKTGLNNVNVSNLDKGVYILSVKPEKGMQQTEKLIIK